MSALFDALELMHSADKSWTSIQAEGVEWTDSRLRHTAVRREMDRRPHGPRGSGQSFTPVFGRYRGEQPKPPDRFTSPWRAWLKSPTHYRTEITPPLIPKITQVVRDKTWWTWQGQGPVTSNLDDEKHGSGSPIQALHLLRPAALLAHAEFEYVRKATAVGRKGLLLEVRPVPTPGIGSMMLVGLIGDRSQIVVDSERGVVLRLQSWHDGAPLQRVTFKRILFDGAIDEDLFRTPEPVIDARQRFRQRRHFWQLDQVAALAPHPVFVPTELDFQINAFPGLWFHGATGDIDEGDPEEGAHASVQVHYSIVNAGRTSTLWVQESTSPFVLDEDKDWQDVGGVRVRTRGTISQVRLAKDGVFIHMECDAYSIDELIILARSLQRLPAEPPSLVTVR